MQFKLYYIDLFKHLNKIFHPSLIFMFWINITLKKKTLNGGSLSSSVVKNSPAMQETLEMWVQPLDCQLTPVSLLGKFHRRV